LNIKDILFYNENMDLYLTKENNILYFRINVFIALLAYTLLMFC